MSYTTFRRNHLQQLNGSKHNCTSLFMAKILFPEFLPIWRKPIYSQIDEKIETTKKFTQFLQFLKS